MILKSRDRWNRISAQLGMADHLAGTHFCPRTVRSAHGWRQVSLGDAEADDRHVVAAILFAPVGGEGFERFAEPARAEGAAGYSSSIFFSLFVCLIKIMTRKATMTKLVAVLTKTPQLSVAAPAALAASAPYVFGLPGQSCYHLADTYY